MASTENEIRQRNQQVLDQLRASRGLDQQNTATKGLNSISESLNKTFVKLKENNQKLTESLSGLLGKVQENSKNFRDFNTVVESSTRVVTGLYHAITMLPKAIPLVGTAISTLEKGIIGITGSFAAMVDAQQETMKYYKLMTITWGSSWGQMAKDSVKGSQQIQENILRLSHAFQMMPEDMRKVADETASRFRWMVQDINSVMKTGGVMEAILNWKHNFDDLGEGSAKMAATIQESFVKAGQAIEGNEIDKYFGEIASRAKLAGMSTKQFGEEFLKVQDQFAIYADTGEDVNKNQEKWLKSFTDIALAARTAGLSTRQLQQAQQVMGRVAGGASEGMLAYLGMGAGLGPLAAIRMFKSGQMEYGDLKKGIEKLMGDAGVNYKDLTKYKTKEGTMKSLSTSEIEKHRAYLKDIEGLTPEAIKTQTDKLEEDYFKYIKLMEQGGLSREQADAYSKIMGIGEQTSVEKKSNLIDLILEQQKAHRLTPGTLERIGLGHLKGVPLDRTMLEREIKEGSKEEGGNLDEILNNYTKVLSTTKPLQEETNTLLDKIKQTLTQTWEWMSVRMVPLMGLVLTSAITGKTVSWEEIEELTKSPEESYRKLLKQMKINPDDLKYSYGPDVITNIVDRGRLEGGLMVGDEKLRTKARSFAQSVTEGDVTKFNDKQIAAALDIALMKEINKVAKDRTQATELYEEATTKGTLKEKSSELTELIKELHIKGGPASAVRTMLPEGPARELWDDAVKILEDIRNYIKELIGIYKNPGEKGGVKGIFSKLFGDTKELIKEYLINPIVSGVTQAFDKIMKVLFGDKYGSKFNKLWDDIGLVFTDLSQIIQHIFFDIKNAIMDTIGEIKGSITTLFSGFNIGVDFVTSGGIQKVKSQGFAAAERLDQEIIKTTHFIEKQVEKKPMQYTGTKQQIMDKSGISSNTFDEYYKNKSIGFITQNPGRPEEYTYNAQGATIKEARDAIWSTMLDLKKKFNEEWKIGDKLTPDDWAILNSLLSEFDKATITDQSGFNVNYQLQESGKKVTTLLDKIRKNPELYSDIFVKRLETALSSVEEFKKYVNDTPESLLSWSADIFGLGSYDASDPEELYEKIKSNNDWQTIFRQGLQDYLNTKKSTGPSVVEGTTLGEKNTKLQTDLKTVRTDVSDVTEEGKIGDVKHFVGRTYDRMVAAIKNQIEKVKGFKYKLGGIGNENFDCSGFVKSILEQIAGDLNDSAAQALFKNTRISADFIKNAKKQTQITQQNIQEMKTQIGVGDVLGLDTGTTSFETEEEKTGIKRYKGIDHIAIVQEKEGNKYVYEFTEKGGPEGKGGFTETLLDKWLNDNLNKQRQVFWGSYEFDKTAGSKAPQVKKMVEDSIDLGLKNSEVSLSTATMQAFQSMFTSKKDEGPKFIELHIHQGDKVETRRIEVDPKTPINLTPGSATLK